jgi:hypothetical protein
MEIVLINLSSKTVTGYGVSLALTYSDGTKAQDSFVECILALTAVSRLPGVKMPGSGVTLNPGEVRHARRFSPVAKGGALPIFAEAVVTAVVFEDGTAVENHRAIQNIAEGRRVPKRPDDVRHRGVDRGSGRPRLTVRRAGAICASRSPFPGRANRADQAGRPGSRGE